MKVNGTAKAKITILAFVCSATVFSACSGPAPAPGEKEIKARIGSFFAEKGYKTIFS